MMMLSRIREAVPVLVGKEEMAIQVRKRAVGYCVHLTPIGGAPRDGARIYTGNYDTMLEDAVNVANKHRQEKIMLPEGYTT